MITAGFFLNVHVYTQFIIKNVFAKLFIFGIKKKVLQNINIGDESVVKVLF